MKGYRFLSLLGLFVCVLGLFSCICEEPAQPFYGNTYFKERTYGDTHEKTQIIFDGENSYTEVTVKRSPDPSSYLRKSVRTDSSVYHYRYDAETRTLLIKEQIGGGIDHLGGGYNFAKRPDIERKLVFNEDYSELREAQRTIDKSAILVEKYKYGKWSFENFVFKLEKVKD